MDMYCILGVNSSLAGDPDGGTGCGNAHKIFLKLWLYFQVQNMWSPFAKPLSLTGQKLLAASVPQADQEGKKVSRKAHIGLVKGNYYFDSQALE